LAFLGLLTAQVNGGRIRFLPIIRVIRNRACGLWCRGAREAASWRAESIIAGGAASSFACVGENHRATSLMRQALHIFYATVFLSVAGKGH
jgi:hypothetical protein